MVPAFIMPGFMKTLSLFTPHAWALAGYAAIGLLAVGLPLTRWRQHPQAPLRHVQAQIVRCLGQHPDGVDAVLLAPDGIDRLAHGACVGVARVGRRHDAQLERHALVAVVITTMFANTGNYGLPLVSFAFGEEALSYAGIYFPSQPGD